MYFLSVTYSKRLLDLAREVHIVVIRKSVFYEMPGIRSETMIHGFNLAKLGSIN